MRLIDADALRKEIRELPNENTDYFYSDVIDREVVQALISEAPTVEARPRGEWIVDKKIYCSECGESICDFIPNPTDAVGLILSNNFCFNCGADMRKEGEVE